jgi:hypothetical protein
LLSKKQLHGAIKIQKDYLTLFILIITNASYGKDIRASKTKLNNLANQRQNSSFIVETAP